MAKKDERIAKQLLAQLGRGEIVRFYADHRTLRLVRDEMLKRQPDADVWLGDGDGVRAYLPNVASAGTAVCGNPRSPYTGGAAVP